MNYISVSNNCSGSYSIAFSVVNLKKSYIVDDALVIDCSLLIVAFA